MMRVSPNSDAVSARNRLLSWRISPISFTRSFARNSFGLGIVIGLMVTLHLTPLVRASEMSAVDGTVCSNPPTDPPELQEWVELQCQVNEAIFDDGIEPSAAYAMASGVHQPGTYSGQTYDGREVELEATFVVEPDLEATAPDLEAQGVSASFVIGRLSGSADSLPVAGLVINTGELTLDDGYLLLVCSILPEADLNYFTNSARIDGGIRIFDLYSFTSEPLGTTSSDIGPLWVSPTDLSTLYSDQPSGEGEPINLGCIKGAYQHYDTCTDGARSAAADCVKDALIDLAICLGADAATTLWNPLGWVGSLVLAGACVAYCMHRLNTCANNLRSALAGCESTLNSDLSECGVILA